MKSNWFALVVCAGLVGCGGSDTGSAMVGIYSVDTWTENDTGCASEGADVLGQQTETMFYVKVESFFGVTFLNVKFCADLADCQTTAGDNSTIYVGTYALDQGNDTDGWTGRSFIGSQMNNMCSGRFNEAVMTSPVEGSVRIEDTGTEVSGFPPDADGFCDLDSATQAAQGVPCTGLEVLTATRVAPLP